MRLKDRLLKWWLFHMKNPVMWKGEQGGFRVVFRRFWLDIETLSGNFKARWIASDYPYGYLNVAVNKDNEETLWGFAERIYMWSMLILRDPGLAKDMDKAVSKYEKRLEKQKPEEDDEEVAIAQMRDLQEAIEKNRDGKKKSKRS